MIRRLKCKQKFACVLVMFWIIIVVLHMKNEEHSLPEAQENTKLSADKMDKFYKQFAPKPNNTFINHHQYTFKISSNICEQNKYHVIMLVPSKPSNYHRRTLIRATYGSVKHYQGKLLTVVFLLGAVNDTNLQDNIFKESEMFEDIVQGNFLDSYKNITVKHIMAMHWFEDNCKADYILKLDDDTFVNPYNLVEFLSTLPVYGFSVIYCKSISGDPPSRDISSKWFTPVSQYPFKIFPPYCLGFAYITIPSVWRTLYRTSSTVSPMDMDDVYVTGILATIGGVVRVDISKIVYDCPEDLNKFDKELFKQSVIFMDRLNKCRDKSFRLWRDVYQR